ncbi:MAG: hypothetical protein WKH64_04560 [Chloroflexia bacterium]
MREYEFASETVAREVRGLAGPEFEQRVQATQELERVWLAWLARDTLATREQLRYLAGLRHRTRVESRPGPPAAALRVRSASPPRPGSQPCAPSKARRLSTSSKIPTTPAQPRLAPCSTRPPCCSASRPLRRRRPPPRVEDRSAPWPGRRSTTPTLQRGRAPHLR